ncbi:class I SAM-dependent methyltransferase [Herpetosiphon sp.]|uniref:Methyltransferase type 11 n=1 Tax=Herpetosiphon aurantiacus (strain ATCC 23779 / DSM 785 / 114-95) TaxID=316274 RepID=A9B0P9_HERA2|nr:class I SAM-dependent methyltransferase [Herpetosiphon sp.]ABX03769.1 Methyltransferase type 11 [Herpetosiphon aurantiacus DSM 785]
MNMTEQPYVPLAPRDASLMDTMLRNEADPAYSRRARRLMQYLDLQDGDTVLDCGCGYGFYTQMIDKLRDLHVVGFDEAFDRLLVGQEHANRATFVRGDGQGMPFANNSFDKILLSEVLEHIPDQQAALHELRRILKPGGILAISVPHANYPLWWDPASWIWTRLGGKPFTHTKFGSIWENHVRLYEPAELVRQVRMADFEVECCEEATHYAIPMTPYVVYGIGKPLIESGILPESWMKSADRMRGDQNQGSKLNPLNLARGIINYVDQLNERPETLDKRSFVNVFVKARKPLS